MSPLTMTLTARIVCVALVPLLAAAACSGSSKKRPMTTQEMIAADPRVATELAGKPIAVVDSASAMAEAAREALGSGANRRVDPGRRSESGDLHFGPGRLDCFATDTSRLDELAPRFLGEPLTGFELVDL